MQTLELKMVYFNQKGHNPDVLTCIANLSNDEVFTPPTIVNEILDLLGQTWAKAHGGESIWENKTVRFIDPFTKSGIFLREITRRLVQGLESQIPNLEVRVNHILTKQIFGMAITNLTALLTRRSVYCSKIANGKHSICSDFKNENGNIWFERTEHKWAGGKREFRLHPISGKEYQIVTGRKCQYCGVTEVGYNRGNEFETHAYEFIHTDDIHEKLKQVFGEEMHFDVVIGNPPYQLSDGGGKGSSAMPIYQKFIEQAKNLDPRFISMIIPSRWFTGGKGLDAFRQEMLADHQLRSIVDFPDSRSVFDGVDIAGGVCYFLWQKGSEGPCEVTTRISDHSWTKTRYLDEFEIFIRDNRAVSIVQKIFKVSNQSFSDLVSARRPFDIDSSELGDRNGDLYLFNSRGDARFDSNRLGPKGSRLINTWRVLVSKTSSEHAGQADKGGQKRVLSRLEVMPPGSVCTESYLVIGPFNSEKEAKGAVSYLKTKFSRFLISTILPTQNITGKSFSILPKIDMTTDWSESKLYEFFGLDTDEINLIESTIRDI